MRTISYLVSFTIDDPTLDAVELERNVVRYLRPIGHDFTVDIDDDRLSTWEATR